MNNINQQIADTGYSCKTISWDDVSRYGHGGYLSCMGSNISDVRLVSKNNDQLFTIRSDNWNEKVATVKASEVAVVDRSDSGESRPITLKTWLENNGLWSPNDDKVSIRFQTTFLPLSIGTAGKEAIEFCPEMYNYNTSDDKDPRNILLMATTQGLTLDTSKTKYQKLMLKSKMDNGMFMSRWIEAEKTKYKVGAEQRETEEEVKESIEKGRAVSSVIGIKAMGVRFNTLLTIQIPLMQKEPERTRGIGSGPVLFYAQSGPYKSKGKACSTSSNFFEAKDCNYSKSMINSDCDDDGAEFYGLESMTLESRTVRTKGSRGGPASARSSAARINMGSDSGVRTSEIKCSDYKRALNQHITVTVVLYHVIETNGSNGLLCVPTKEDVLAAINELEELYRSCGSAHKLADSTFMIEENVKAKIYGSAYGSIIKESSNVVDRTEFPEDPEDPDNDNDNDYDMVDNVDNVVDGSVVNGSVDAA
jgi:huntingtin